MFGLKKKGQYCVFRIVPEALIVCIAECAMYTAEEWHAWRSPLCEGNEAGYMHHILQAYICIR